MKFRVFWVVAPCSHVEVDDVSEVRTASIISTKFRVFWDVAPCSYVEVDRRFRGAYRLHHQYEV
jgi:hypothetical protein